MFVRSAAFRISQSTRRHVSLVRSSQRRNISSKHGNEGEKVLFGSLNMGLLLKLAFHCLISFCNTIHSGDTNKRVCLSTLILPPPQPGSPPSLQHRASSALPPRHVPYDRLWHNGQLHNDPSRRRDRPHLRRHPRHSHPDSRGFRAGVQRRVRGAFRGGGGEGGHEDGHHAAQHHRCAEETRCLQGESKRWREERTGAKERESGGGPR